MVALEQAKFGDAGDYPQQEAFMCVPLMHLQSPQEMPLFPIEFCLALNRDGNNIFENKEMWEKSNFLEQPDDPIILGTSPMNYRADTLTLFSFWPLNFVPMFHSQSRLPTSAV